MLLDLLQGAPTAAGTYGSVSSVLTSLHEELSFTEILSSCALPDIATSSMPLLHILQEGVVPNDAYNTVLHAYHTDEEGQTSPLIFSTSLHNIIPQQDNKQPYTQNSMKTSNLCKEIACLPKYVPPCMRGGYINCERSALFQSPCERFNETQQPSTSSATSEPSSTLDDNTEAGEIAVQNQQIRQMDSGSHWLFSHAGGKRGEEAVQNCTQTSLDEGSSVQESTPSAHIATDTCRHAVVPLITTPIEESCSLENYPSCDVPTNWDTHINVMTSARPAKKRKRTKICKNSEEVESQRMTHIAVERNRRRQMNEHLSVLRSLMPAAYVQRGDQASIIGGAIDFVKGLEHVLQALQTQKKCRACKDIGSFSKQDSSLVLEDLMQFSHYTNTTKCSYIETPKDIYAHLTCEGVAVEVKLIGSSILVKVLTHKIPHQLLNSAISIESLHLKIMHLNITTIGQSVLYSFNLAVKGESQFQTANDIAVSIQKIFKI